MDIPRISENSDLFWCYQRTKQQRNETCWEFSDDVFHHWIILRGTAKLNGMELTNFNLITRNNKSKVCTTNKYIWIIYVGRKSSETPVNIYSKTNQTQTISDRRVTEKKDPSERGITKDEQNSVNQDSTTGFLVDKKESEAGKLVKDMDFMSRKSSETPVNIYQTQTISHRRVAEKKDPSEDGITKDEQNSGNQDISELVKDMSFMKIIILISAIGGVMLILAITISILCCCCHRCNKATITESVPEPKKDNVKKNVKDENLEDAVKNVAKDVVKVAIPEAPNCQMREGFVPHEAMRDTFDSVGFWSEDEDYNPEDNNRHSKMKPGIYAVSDRLYKRKSPQSDIYMNPVVPPPPSYQKDTDTYINMNQKPKPPNKQFNIFL